MLDEDVEELLDQIMDVTKKLDNCPDCMKYQPQLKRIIQLIHRIQLTQKNVEISDH